MTESISKEEAIVLDVIQEYLNQNRSLDLEKVIPFIRNKFSKTSININNNGIKVILKSLIENKFIVQGSKFTKDKVLRNTNRNKIYKIIKKNPGLYFNRLVDILKLGNHILAWHINILLKFNFINIKRIENHECYFISDFKSLNHKAPYILSKKKSKHILSYLKQLDNEGFTKTEVSNKLGIHYNTISKYFKEFEEIGLLEKKKLTNKTLYFLDKIKLEMI